MDGELISREEAVSFLQKLIQSNSCNPPGAETETARLLADFLSARGVDVRLLPVEGGRCNVEARIAANGVKKKSSLPGKELPARLLFCGHMDTVGTGEESQWMYSPHSGAIVGPLLYGRGASDMKSGLAAMAVAVAELQMEEHPLAGELLLLATVGEEVDCAGAYSYKSILDQMPVDAMVIGEPTKERIVVGHKGALWIEVAVDGKTAHASMPEQGINAIEQMMEVMAALKAFGQTLNNSHPVLGTESLTLTRINGGIQTNMIPDRCLLQLDIRTIPPRSHAQLLMDLESVLKGLSQKLFGLSWRAAPLLDRAPLWTEPEHRLIQLASSLLPSGHREPAGVSFFTDGSVLNPDCRIPTLIYGPGDDKLAHQPNEHVHLDAFMRSIQFYKRLAIAFLDRPRR